MDFKTKRNFSEKIEFLRLIYALEEKEENSREKKNYLNYAIEIAKNTVEFYPENYLSHKWYVFYF